jgi:PAS domain S-box-containing protein
VIDRTDWSVTPLGPPGRWPAVLRMLVRVMLTSRFPMWLGWGGDLNFLYNDAYARDTLGVKHPWALGRPAREVWSEIWRDIGPRIETVLTTGEATWDESLLLLLERSGYREETYHTFSYSPVSDVDGHIAGMLCVVSEETDRVIAERRMANLRDLAAGLAGARSEQEVFRVAERQLAANGRDLPCTLLYVLEPSGRCRLAAGTGFYAGHPAAPAVLDPGAAETPWPVASLLTQSEPVLVDDLPSRVAALPTGEWNEPPACAVVLRLAERAQAEPAGFLVAGLNPYRPAQTVLPFVELLAGQIAGGIAAARAYEAERRRAESLAELDRAKSEFFSNVSHEFRTPLTLILGPADDALADDLEPLPPAQRGRVQVVQRNARRLRRLVNDMLDFARIESGRMQAETVETDLGEWTREIALSFAPAIERAGLGFSLAIEPLPRTVYVDRDMWEKVILNLLSNALKFTLEGEVRLRLRPEGDAVELVVEDTGVGIAPDQLPHLFERFFRAPGAVGRSHEGTGIGLALVSELVRLHGGAVSVASTPGSGSAFTVRIPHGSAGTALAASQPRDSLRQAYLDEALQWNAEQPAEADAAAKRSQAGRTSDATVLVVDDNPDMRAYVGRLLAPFWQVLLAADGEEALRLVRSRRPHLVLSDVMMPRVDGFGLLAALRSDPATATIPVVFLSARAGEEAAVEGLDAGADDYLVKPFSAIELIARVRSNLELAALRNEEAAWRAALVESLHDALVVLDSAGAVVEVNAAFEELLGFGRRDVPYKPPFPWYPDEEEHPAERDRVTWAHEHLLRNGQVREVVRLRHRLGHLVTVRATGKAVGESDSRRYVVAMRDVTAELATSEREAALAQLGVRLAEASDVAEVQRAGLEAFRRVFTARRGAIVSFEDGEIVTVQASPQGGPGPGGRVQGVAAATVVEARATGSVVTADVQPKAATVPLSSAIAAQLGPDEKDVVLWLDLGTPRPVSSEERSLFGVLCGYFAQARHRAQLFDENRTVATALQRSILGPTQVPAGTAVRYLPAVRPLEVGGDWYDLVDLPGGRLALVVGDCTGRGLEAATTMGQLRSACRALLLEERGPGAVLEALDRFAERVQAARCTTVFCAVLDPGGTLRYSSAGHLPALLADEEGDTRLLDDAGGLPLAIRTGRSRPEASTAFREGSTLLLYTDGLVERRGESLDAGFGRARANLAANRHLPAEQLADALVAQLLEPGRQEDDVALVLHRRPAAGC